MATWSENDRPVDPGSEIEGAGSRSVLFTTLTPCIVTFVVAAGNTFARIHEASSADCKKLR